MKLISRSWPLGGATVVLAACLFVTQPASGAPTDIAGLLQSNGISPGLDITHMVAVGSEGTLLHDGSQLFRFRQGSPDAETIVPAEALTIPAGLPNNVWVRGSIHLAAALRSVLESGDHSGLSLAATFDNGLHTQRALDAARASSAAAGNWSEID